MRLRSPKNIIDMINKQDPDNQFTLYALRQLIKKKEIDVVYAGSNHLVDFDYVLEYLKNPSNPKTDAKNETKIHRIEVNKKR